MKNIVKKIYYLLIELKYKISIYYRYLFVRKTFSIKKGYIHRSKYSYFDDTNNTDNWQVEVYEKAKKYADEFNLNIIIDYGCGSAYKLIKYFDTKDITGIDVSPTFEFLKNKYPSKKWLRFGDFEMETVSGDIVICSDVIEHVLNPDELLENINKIQNVKYIFISTPDRNFLPIPKFGPPLNETHIREWTFEELNEYVGGKFDIIEHFISNKNQKTQLIIAKKKNYK